MYQELESFKNTNSFQYTTADQLDLVCNAPAHAAGLFLVFDVKEDTKELIMVGSTGTIQNNGTLKAKSGLFDKIVNGSQFTKSARKFSWPTQMKKEGITTLEVIWFETFTDEKKIIPTYLEGQVLQHFFDENGVLPRWNVAF